MLTTKDVACCKTNSKDDKEWIPNTGRYNLTRLLYSCLLSFPNFRYRIKIPKQEIPNIRDVGPFWPLSKAALKAKCAERIEDLFDLGPRPKHFAREHAVPKRHSGQGPYEGGHWAAPGALITPMRVRTTHLAVPRRSYAKGTKKFYGKKLSEKQRKILDIYIDNTTKTVYYSPPKKVKKKPKRRSKAEGVGFKWPQPKPKVKKPLDMERIGKLATPKPQPLAPEINRGKGAGIEELTETMTKLTKLPHRYKVKKPDPNQIFKVKKGALEYNISDRVAEISQPKPSFGEPPFKPFKISPAALHCTASDRITKLATARERKPPPDDTKEDAFTVPPLALKAMCTPRTAELAEPRVRK